MGISVLARWAVLPHLEAGTLQASQLTRTGFQRQWKAVVIGGTVPDYIPEFTRLIANLPVLSQAAPRLELQHPEAGRTRSA